MTFFIAAIAKRFSHRKGFSSSRKRSVAFKSEYSRNRQVMISKSRPACLIQKMMRCFAVILLSTSVNTSILRRHEESIRSFAYFVDFIAQSEKILKSLRFLSRIAQQ